MAAPEPSPFLHTLADQLPSTTKKGTPRKSSGIGQEIRAGDTGPSLGTGLASISDSSVSSNDQPSEQKKSKRRKPSSLPRRCKRFAVKHTWTIPLLLLLAFISLYAINPTESNIIHRFIFLSYRQPALKAGAPPQYGKGRWDIAFVSFYTIVLSFTREFIMQEMLRPLARFCGIKSRGKQLRFMEQMYTAVYFAVMGPAGMYVMRRSPVWYFNTRGMYEFFPHRTHEACFKFYYLLQAAYWAQQAIVMLLGMEKLRKDFKELVAHHIVTLALISLSYRFHFTYMGIAVYLTHDISDFFLAISKSLHYIDSPLTPPFFATLIAVWVYLRHYLNLRILFSLLTEFRTVGPYELNWETQQYKCWISNIVTFGLLTALQALNLFWLFCLLRVMYRYLVHNIAEDDRSEAEELELEEVEPKTEVAKKVEPLPLLNGNGVASGSANCMTKATGKGTAALPELGSGTDELRGRLGQKAMPPTTSPKNGKPRSDF